MDAALHLGRQLLLAVVVGGLASAVQGCESPSGPQTLGRTSRTTALTHFAGCEEVHAKRGCRVGSSAELTLWVSGSEPPVVEAASGTILESEPAVGGQRVRIRVGSDASKLVLQHAGGRLSLPLWSADVPPELRRARAALDRGDAVAAAKVLDGPSATGEPALRARARSLRARAKLRQGDLEGALQDARGARPLAEQAGLLSLRVDDTLLEAYLLATRTTHLDQAASLLRSLDAIGYPHGMARLSYFRGVVARRAHQPRQAMAALRESLELSRKLDLSDVGRDASDVFGNVLAALGRHEEAEQVLWPVGPKGCARRRALNNRAWRKLRRGAERSLAEPELSRKLASEAAGLLQQATQTPCDDASLQRQVRLNAGLAAVAMGRADEADRLLKRVRDQGPSDAESARWIWELEGRIRLAQGAFSAAAAAFQREGAAAEGPHSAAVWRAQTGVGQALLREDRPAQAAAAFERGERARRAQSLAVPLGEGRGAFLGERDASLRGLVQARLAMHDAAAALQALRRGLAQRHGWAAYAARIEALTGEQRARYEQAVGRHRRLRDELERMTAQDWSLAADELRAVQPVRDAQRRRVFEALESVMAAAGHAGRAHTPLAPRPGELLLAFVRVRDGWLVLARLDQQVRALRLSGQPGTGDATWLFDPLQAQLQRATQVTVLSLDPLPFDVHALPFGTLPLAAVRPVSYGIDVPTPQAKASDRVLVVADPGGDLDAARAEALRVGARFQTFQPVSELVGAQATRAALLRALPDADLFHYAGHASLGDRAELSAGLELAGGSRLTVGDVLGLSAVPRRVVLSACDAGRVSQRVHGLAHAFVARGADWVVAPTRPVDDTQASHLMREFYRVLGQGHGYATALGRAQGRLFRQYPEGDWASFRAYARLR